MWSLIDMKLIKSFDYISFIGGSNHFQPTVNTDSFNQQDMLFFRILLRWINQAVVVVKVGFYIVKESIRRFIEELDKTSETPGYKMFGGYKQIDSSILKNLQTTTYLQHNESSVGKVNPSGLSNFNDNFKSYFRVLWVFILVASYFGIVRTCLYQWERFEARPTVISLERDFRNWNLTLPGRYIIFVRHYVKIKFSLVLAITVCYGNKVNESKAQEFIEKFKLAKYLMRTLTN